MAKNSTQPPHATCFVATTRGVLSYSQLAPLLAERVLRVNGLRLTVAAKVHGKK